MISDFFLALFLALIQGLTEFLPVSSSAHLLLPSLIFGAKDFGIVFDISVHAGTLAAVIYYFNKEILGLFQAWMPWTKTRSKENFALGLNLIVATLPIILVGLLFSDLTESRSANIDSIAWSNLLFAGLLFAAFKSSTQSKSLKECLEMEYQLCQHMVYRNDFDNGVYAVLVSKTHKPKWSPSTIENINFDEFDKMFEQSTHGQRKPSLAVGQLRVRIQKLSICITNKCRASKVKYGVTKKLLGGI